MEKIHPTAVVSPGATLANGVEIGPFCVVGENVVLEEDVRLVSHVSISGRTTLGARTVVYPFASLGHPPQDLKFKGESSTLVIGSDNVIREYVTMQPGTETGRMMTQVGNNGLFMAGVHVAHDCIVGNNVIMANYATLAGHVEVGDYAIIGGLSGVHQFTRIGAHAMVGGLSPLDGDVIPYGSVRGERAFLNGLNLVGLKRRGFSKEEMENLRSVYKILFSSEGTLSERIEKAQKLPGISSLAQELIDFVLETSKCGICLPHES